MKFYAKWYIGLTFNSFSIARGRGAKFLCVKKIKLKCNGRNGYPHKATKMLLYWGTKIATTGTNRHMLITFDAEGILRWFFFIKKLYGHGGHDAAIHYS